MIKFGLPLEIAVWSIASLGAGTIDNGGVEQVLNTYGPWGLIALAGAVLLRFVIKDIREDQKVIKENQIKILKKLGADTEGE